MTESKSKVSTSPTLIGDLPRAENEALKAFIEIQNNTYENKSLGKQKQVEEAYPCDCRYRPGEELNSHTACGENADCINRLTQTECTDECRSKSHCQNQRFQRKQYAPIEIVQTEHKGFGLRAGGKISRNDMIYEYIGEVVTEHTLLRRMRAYNDEGIQHFYFMMLQKGEFIDATKKGGIGRFANHSCNPNCYVAKWVVGNRIRMAIFAKRNIIQDEELTFNYNVDRYGNDAQVCHCGEANCVGFIGGKTQTEVATMDDVFLDALGLDDDEIRALSINIPKKVKKGKKGAAAPPTTTNLEEEELKFSVKPLKVEQVAPLLIAIRKAMGTTRPMLVKLLGRLQLTEDLPSLRQFLRLRGLGLLAEILEESFEDTEISTLILQSIQNLPMTNRIKIEDMKLEDKIQPYTESEDESLKAMSTEMLEKWSQLEKGFRIPRKTADDDDVPTIVHYTLDDEEASRPRKKPRVATFIFDLPPAPVASASSSVSAPTPVATSTAPMRWPEPMRPAWTEPSQTQLDAIIARAAETAAAEEAAAASSSSTAPNKEKKHRSSSDKSKSKNTEALKEKQLKKLIGSVIVKSASKYAKQLGRDAFKKYAEECTVTIAEKEKKSSTYATAKLDKLSDEKQAKIKKFTKDFFTKAVHKMEKKKASRLPHSPSKSSLSSTIDPRRSSVAATASSSSVTLPCAETTPPSPSTERHDESQPDGEAFVEDLVDQMFGEDEVDEEETLKADQTPDGDMDVDGDQLKMGTVENTPVGDGSEPDDQSQCVKMEQDLVDLMPRVS
ncbi:histone methyltransferase set2 [Tulasnella sp. JGI-2019a]|nr:histone methyltransferase set2 [Tulasnella sp. JGI-2019a]KAG9013729.1 histone methyltransferase set2 [Tulasnella sp. JGI-2019a]KAG9037117.1 histone methyltransferase set2 [Tulasnella sp. JGI-2019a]